MSRQLFWLAVLSLTATMGCDNAPTDDTSDPAPPTVSGDLGREKAATLPAGDQPATPAPNKLPENAGGPPEPFPTTCEELGLDLHMEADLWNCTNIYPVEVQEIIIFDDPTTGCSMSSTNFFDTSLPQEGITLKSDNGCEVVFSALSLGAENDVVCTPVQ